MSEQASAVIELADAAFGYGEGAVISGVDLTVTAGETIAVLGPNGSGKSTLMKGLLGLNELVHGEVRLFGTPMGAFHERARIGYVPQRHTLSASMPATASEIVVSGRLPRLGWFGRLRAADRDAVRRALELVGLSDRADTEVSTLSGGQQRRVLIARALAAAPDVLVMDEPTAGVDAASQHVLAGVLERLVAEGLTLVVVTHELGPLRDLLSRVVVVDGGRVRFDGPSDRFEAERGEVHHDHDSHHHDHELAFGTPHSGPGALHGPADPWRSSR